VAVKIITPVKEKLTKVVKKVVSFACHVDMADAPFTKSPSPTSVD
jgi:hypothetical protein